MIRLDLHVPAGQDHPRPACFICAECEQAFTSARWLVDHVAAGCKCAKHAAPPWGSSVRERLSSPYIGRHRIDPDVELAAEFDRVFDLAGDPPEYQPDEDGQ